MVQNNGAGWNSWWMDISTARLLAFIKHLNEKGIDQVCAEMQVRRQEHGVSNTYCRGIESVYRAEERAV
jgi:hypothetical protein